MSQRIGLAALVLLSAGFASGQVGADYRVCWQQVEADRAAVDGYLCFRRVGRSAGELQTALHEIGRLELLYGRGPELALVRGGVLADLGDPDAPNLLAVAASMAHEAGAGRCEVLARLELASIRAQWDPAAADAQLEQAGSVAADLADADLLRRVRIASAWRHLRENRPARAATELEALAAEMPPDSPLPTQVGVLEGLGFAAWSTGRLREARESYRELLDLAEGHADRWLAARATASFTLLDLQVENPAPETMYDRLAKAVEQARRASNPIAELKLRSLLSQAAAPADRVREWQRVRDQARALGAVEDELLALRFLARLWMAGGEPDQAIAAIDEARRRAHQTGLRDAEIRSTCGGVELRWAAGRMAAAHEAIDECLGLIDRLRTRAALPVDRARVFGQFSYIPRNIADALLSFENDIDTALAVLDRYRARSLEEAIGEPPAAPSGKLVELRRQLSQVQRELAFGHPPASRQRELERARVTLEADELRIARAMAVSGAPASEPRLAELQGDLDPGEILVVFSLLRFPTELWQTTGCWAIVVTRESARAVPLAAFDTIGPAVDALCGLLGRSDQVAAVAAARVYELLLAPLEPELAGAERAVFLLDEPLHELPLAALRPSPESAPLVSRLEIQETPSLELWQRWRHMRRAGVPRGAAVVIADPRLVAVADSALREAQLPTVAELGRLPGAAAEGKGVARRLGRETQLLWAGAATEAAVKRALSKSPRILHIAAHAVVDGRRPDRSAVVLAPGDRQDGLLQPREIADLELGGCLVVLSACRSLEGEVLDGDGVVGLGHAFLQAGARAVIGAVHPVDDRRAPELMSELYERLAEGEPVARALARAQAASAARGRPASEWAAVLLVGDGGLRIAPSRDPRPHRTWPPSFGALALCAVVALAALIGWLRLRRAPHD